MDNISKVHNPNMGKTHLVVFSSKSQKLYFHNMSPKGMCPPGVLHWCLLELVNANSRNANKSTCEDTHKASSQASPYPLRPSMSWAKWHYFPSKKREDLVSSSWDLQIGVFVFLLLNSLLLCSWIKWTSPEGIKGNSLMRLDWTSLGNGTFLKEADGEVWTMLM